MLPAESKMGARVPKNGQRGLDYPYVLGRSCQLLLNKFFEPSTPSIRKVDDGGEKNRVKRKKENNSENSGHLHHCQLSPQTLTDRNADCSCQNFHTNGDFAKKCKICIIICLKYQPSSTWGPRSQKTC